MTQKAVTCVRFLDPEIFFLQLNLNNFFQKTRFFFFLSFVLRRKKCRLNEAVLVFLSGSLRHFPSVEAFKPGDFNKAAFRSGDFTSRVAQLRKKCRLFSEFQIPYPRRDQLTRSAAKDLCKEFIARDISAKKETSEEDDVVDEKKKQKKGGVLGTYKRVQRLAHLLDEPSPDQFVGKIKIYILHSSYYDNYLIEADSSFVVFQLDK